MLYIIKVQLRAQACNFVKNKTLVKIFKVKYFTFWLLMIRGAVRTEKYQDRNFEIFRISFSTFSRHTLNPFMHNVVKWPNILEKSCGVNTAKFSKYVWPFYNIMNEKG